MVRARMPTGNPETTTMAILLRRLCSTITIVLLLTACGQGPESGAGSASTESASTPGPETAPETEADSDLEGLIDDPQALRQAIRDPEQRDALIAALREQRRSGDAREELRERMRERREQILARQESGERRTMSRGGLVSARSAWWNDEAVAEELELVQEQIAALAGAHQALQSARVESRQMRAGSQRELLDAIGRADRDQVATLIERRSEAAVEQSRAEAEWMQTLLDQLDDRQLATLAERYPQLLLMRL